MSQITTITFFHYQGFRNKVWAFGMMQFAHAYLQKAEGQTFYKLMGSGKGMGFNPLPDWSTYCLLQVWESETPANHFFESSDLIKKYKRHTDRQSTLFLKKHYCEG